MVIDGDRAGDRDAAAAAGGQLGALLPQEHPFLEQLPVLGSAPNGRAMLRA